MIFIFTFYTCVCPCEFSFNLTFSECAQQIVSYRTRRSNVAGNGIGNGKNGDCGNTNVPITGHSNNNSNSDHQCQAANQPWGAFVPFRFWFCLFSYWMDQFFHRIIVDYVAVVFVSWHVAFAKTIHAESFSFVFTRCVMCMLFSLRPHSLFFCAVCALCVCVRALCCCAVYGFQCTCESFWLEFEMEFGSYTKAEKMKWKNCSRQKANKRNWKCFATTIAAQYERLSLVFLAQLSNEFTSFALCFL